jgi:integrase
LASNKRQNLRRRVEHEPIKCMVCGETFTPRRNDANTCSSRCRQRFYRENRARRATDEAGLPQRCVVHGLRKAAARRFAEAGCTVHEIASITGHVTLKEVERYTKAVDRERLARAAMARMAARGQADRVSDPGGVWRVHS